jgi:hypothetical protein
MSVILMVDRERERGARCLRSILGQSIIDRLEVLLIDLAPAAASLAGSDHPRVEVLRLPSSMSWGALNAAAVLRTRAPIVAFIEEHCVALPGWAESLVRAHEGPAAGVTGERNDFAPDQTLAQLLHLLDHGPWSAPATAQATTSLPDGNVAYKRDILMRYRDRLDVYLHCEGLLHKQMIKDGLTLRVEPAARYQHEYDDSVTESVARWFWQGYLIGATRAELRGWTPRQRRARVWGFLRSPPLPPPLLRRLIGAHGRVVRSNLGAALGYSLAPMIGEILGTAFGAYGFSDRARHYLLNSRRG